MPVFTLKRSGNVVLVIYKFIDVIVTLLRICALYWVVNSILIQFLTDLFINYIYMYIIPLLYVRFVFELTCL